MGFGEEQWRKGVGEVVQESSSHGLWIYVILLVFSVSTQLSAFFFFALYFKNSFRTLITACYLDFCAL